MGVETILSRQESTASLLANQLDGRSFVPNHSSQLATTSHSSGGLPPTTASSATLVLIVSTVTPNSSVGDILGSSPAPGTVLEFYF